MWRRSVTDLLCAFRGNLPAKWAEVFGDWNEGFSGNFCGRALTTFDLKPFGETVVWASSPKRKAVAGQSAMRLFVPPTRLQKRRNGWGTDGVVEKLSCFPTQAELGWGTPVHTERSRRYGCARKIRPRVNSLKAVLHDRSPAPSAGLCPASASIRASP